MTPMDANSPDSNAGTISGHNRTELHVDAHTPSTGNKASITPADDIPSRIDRLGRFEAQIRHAGHPSADHFSERYGEMTRRYASAQQLEAIARRDLVSLETLAAELTA